MQLVHWLVFFIHRLVRGTLQVLFALRSLQNSSLNDPALALETYDTYQTPAGPVYKSATIAMLSAIRLMSAFEQRLTSSAMVLLFLRRCPIRLPPRVPPPRSGFLRILIIMAISITWIQIFWTPQTVQFIRFVRHSFRPPSLLMTISDQESSLQCM